MPGGIRRRSLCRRHGGALSFETFPQASRLGIVGYLRLFRLLWRDRTGAGAASRRATAIDHDHRPLNKYARGIDIDEIATYLKTYLHARLEDNIHSRFEVNRHSRLFIVVITELLVYVSSYFK